MEMCRETSPEGVHGATGNVKPNSLPFQPPHRNPLSLQTSLGPTTQGNFPKPPVGRARCRCPVLGSRSILPRAEPLLRLLFALGEDSQALSPDNFGTKQLPKAALLTNEGFQAFVLNPTLFSLQTAGGKK